VGRGPIPQEFLISSGSVDITPRRPVMLGGYYKRTAPFTSVASSLEANVVLIRGASSSVTIVSCDLLYPGETLRSKLLKNLGLADRSEELFFCASHTHSAPMTAPSMPQLGVADDEYVQYVATQITALIKSLERQGESCVCTYHEGNADHSMNRRLVRSRLTRSGFARSSGFGPNPNGDRDESVRILEFSKSDGKPCAVIWNYACHPTDFPGFLEVSAEYPGIVRSRLRSELGNIPILFLQGFSGDVRPPFSGRSAGIAGFARRVLVGPQFRQPQRLEWEQWSSSLAESIASVARSSPRTLRFDSLMLKRVEVAENEFAAGGSGNKSLVWHLVDCGGFRIVGINAEPVVKYRRLLEESLSGTGPLLTVGCLDQPICYLPSDNMIPEQGYEVEGFRSLFNFDARFQNRLQDAVIRPLREALT
jgi:neutral ceramidase